MRKLAIARSKARASAREGNDAESSESLTYNLASAGTAFSNSGNQDSSAASSDEVFIGFARIYSGNIKLGQTIKVLGPKYNAADPSREEYMSEMQVERLFLLMGKDLQDLDSVAAGNVFGILLNNEHIFKTSTLSSTDQCASLAGIRMDAPPILRVALEPSDPTQL
jgi:ribosome assembly protein 1